MDMNSEKSFYEALPVDSHLPMVDRRIKEPQKLQLEENEPRESTRSCWDKVYPSESPIRNPEPPSPSFSGEGVGVHFPVTFTRSSDTSSSTHSFSATGSPYRSDEEGEDPSSSAFGVPNKNFHEASVLDLDIVSSRDVFNRFMSMGSRPTGNEVHDSGSLKNGPYRQEDMYMGRPAENTNGPTQLQQKSEKLPKPLNFESNEAIWFPPPPEDIDDEIESNLFTYDDENDEGENWGDAYLGTADQDTFNPAKDVDWKESLNPLVLEHFRSLVLQLLHAEHITLTKDTNAGDWLEVITAIAWQAAKYIKPDTSRGGSMDPCDYLKIKCVASGSPGDSKLVKGIVCKKNIKHKRMISQYNNARLLILGGALEYQRTSSHSLASVQTLLEQENDHLNTVVSNIEALHPNVLLVEKTVSPYALDKLFAKEISVVLNVKRSLLERVARCTGASIIASTDHVSLARLGHCELFHLEKVSEEHEPLNQKMPSKTLMFFEGCPRRVCCTVLLKGSTRDELKKVKHVMPYAVFAAYHLSLETSFLAAEAACAPDMGLKPLNMIPEASSMSMSPVDPGSAKSYAGDFNVSSTILRGGDLRLDLGSDDSLSELANTRHDYLSEPNEVGFRKHLHQEEHGDLGCKNDHGKESLNQESGQVIEVVASTPAQVDDALISGEQKATNDNTQSILVSFSSNCMVNRTACERARVLRVKFYGPSDKSLGRYLRDDLFDQSNRCKSCNEPAEAHVMCYTHQNANLTIKVRHLPDVKLPGEQDGKIWMWHRCLKCELVEGVPPASKRVVLSDAAWGLSFGKFLELSFYNHVTGNRLAKCGHSLQRNCLRFFGLGSMVASFQYSHIDILSVHLPPAILEFNHPVEECWIKEEASELFGKAEAMFLGVSRVLEALETKALSGEDGNGDASELQNHFTELKDMLANEKKQYKEWEDLLQLPTNEGGQVDGVEPDIRELRHLKDSLSASWQSWDHRLNLLEALLKSNSSTDAQNDDYDGPWGSDKFAKDSIPANEVETISRDDGSAVSKSSPDQPPSTLFDSIDSAWSGVEPAVNEDDDPSSPRKMNLVENPSVKRLMGTTRVYSLDSLQRAAEETMWKGLRPSSSLYLTRSPHSFHVFGDYRSMIEDPVSQMQGSSLQLSRNDSGRPDSSSFIESSFTSSASLFSLGARLPHENSMVIHDDELTSIVSYALSSKEYKHRVLNRLPVGAEGISEGKLLEELDPLDADLLSVSEEQHPHPQISFGDESSKGPGKLKYSVTCYFAREFDALRRICCPNETDYIRSLSRCRKWSGDGGKSKVYFARSLDDRFIIKQVTKTEMESFEAFGPNYFKYMTDALKSQSPTCLAKILGIYQVGVKGMMKRGGKEATKMDLMVMENLFFNRNISKIYDLKGSVRSRYIPETEGTNKVLLDMNLLETVGKNPIFVANQAKRNLERAIWNDTSFLASMAVMDYSLLVGVDEEREELVMGIIDFMRQYTWDKHLETWVKASGILGGPKNASPTVISPKEYKKRFRKAMTSYFLTVPDQWAS